jgi:hypothetical protein
MEGRHVSDVIYLYGFVPPGAPAAPSLAGIDDAPVERLDLDGVHAVISRLPAEQWSAQHVEARLDDLGWVGEQGVAHERVVLWFVDHADILPARLFTMYTDEAALRSAAAHRAAALQAQLRRLGGRREWNLKVAYDAAALALHGSEVSDELRRMDETMAAAPPGRRYLLQRQKAELQKKEVARSARRLAAELLDALRPFAEAVQALPLATTDEGGTVILNAALLVTRDGEPALRAEADRHVARLAGLGMIIAFTGPWAPYRFIEAMTGADAHA